MIPGMGQQLRIRVKRKARIRRLKRIKARVRASKSQTKAK